MMAYAPRPRMPVYMSFTPLMGELVPRVALLLPECPPAENNAMPVAERARELDVEHESLKGDIRERPRASNDGLHITPD